MKTVQNRHRALNVQTIFTPCLSELPNGLPNFSPTLVEEDNEDSLNLNIHKQPKHNEGAQREFIRFSSVINY